MDPAEKRLAIQVEDHVLAYGDFSGTITAPAKSLFHKQAEPNTIDGRKIFRPYNPYQINLISRPD